MIELPGHLAEKYRLYAIHLDPGVNKRPNQAMLIVHIGRPVSFKTVCEKFIMEHVELTVVSSGEKIQTNGIIGIQKIDNANKPNYELTYDGLLKEIV